MIPSLPGGLEGSGKASSWELPGCRLWQGTVCLYKHQLLALSRARGTQKNCGAPSGVLLSAFGKGRRGQAESWAERRTVRLSKGECGVLQLGGVTACIRIGRG